MGRIFPQARTALHCFPGLLTSTDESYRTKTLCIERSTSAGIPNGRHGDLRPNGPSDAQAQNGCAILLKVVYTIVLHSETHSHFTSPGHRGAERRFVFLTY